MAYPYYSTTTVTSDVWTEFDFGRPMYAVRIINDGTTVVQVSTDGTSDNIIDELSTTEVSLASKVWLDKVYCKAETISDVIRVKAW
jgi:hypothetical protein